jgi:hypothetical protein
VSTLEEYQRHLEKFGPELLLVTAATELPERELGELKALVGSYQRVYRRHKGSWVERRQGPPRECALEECGLDLSPNAPKNARYHKHCRGKAYRRREAKAVAVAPPAPSGGRVSRRAAA